jgi:hypothetical protein
VLREQFGQRPRRDATSIQRRALARPRVEMADWDVPDLGGVALQRPPVAAGRRIPSFLSASAYESDTAIAARASLSEYRGPGVVIRTHVRARAGRK